MSNPFQSLKYLPWASLFQSAGATVLIGTLIEFLVFQLASLIFDLTLNDTGEWILAFFFGVLLPIFLAVGLGILALWVATRLFPQIPLRRDTMWALVACVLILLPVKNFLVTGFIFLNPFGVRFGLSTILLVALGLFGTGRRYWR